jgi:S1-C subfamily serine protease
LLNIGNRGGDVMRGLWIFLVAGLLALSAQAQDRVPGSLAEVQMSFAPIVREAGPAVVNIYARRVVQSQSLRSFALS